MLKNLELFYKYSEPSEYAQFRSYLTNLNKFSFDKTDEKW